MVNVQDRHDRAVADLPDIDELVVDAGDRGAEGLRSRKQLGPGVCRVGIAEAEVNVRGGECFDGVEVGHVDGLEQDANDASGAVWRGCHYRPRCRAAVNAIDVLLLALK